MLTRKSRFAAIGLLLAAPLISACEDPLAPTERPEVPLTVNPVPVDTDERTQPPKGDKKDGERIGKERKQ